MHLVVISMDVITKHSGPAHFERTIHFSRCRMQDIGEAAKAWIIDHAKMQGWSLMYADACVYIPSVVSRKGKHLRTGTGYRASVQFNGEAWKYDNEG